MDDQAMLKKGSAKRMRVTVTSSAQARRISRALQILQRVSLSELEQRKLVKKMSVASRGDIYAFRAGPKERIVFSPRDGKILIHDIIDFSDRHSAKSLLREVQRTKSTATIE